MRSVSAITVLLLAAIADHGNFAAATNSNLPDEQTPSSSPPSSFLPHPGYKYMAKACVSGNNIALYTNKSVTECADLCDTIDNCFGFNYRGSSTIYKPRNCQPKSNSNIDGCNAVLYNLDFYKRLANPTASPIPSAEPSTSVLPTTSLTLSSILDKLSSASSSASKILDFLPLENAYLIQGQDVLNLIASDPDTLTNIFHEGFDEVKVITRDGSWVGQIILPEASKVPNLSEFQMTCNSTQNVNVTYNSGSTTLPVYNGNYVILAAVEGAWLTKEEYNTLTDRCGPLFSGRTCVCIESYYCNTDNGRCGNTDDHRNAQASIDYDCPLIPHVPVIQHVAVSRHLEETSFWSFFKCTPFWRQPWFWGMIGAGLGTISLGIGILMACSHFKCCCFK